jgi:hypothetical protein
MPDKIKVETTGDFMLMDPMSGDIVEPDSVCEVVHSGFIQDRIELGQLRVVEDDPAPVVKPAK